MCCLVVPKLPLTKSPDIKHVCKKWPLLLSTVRSLEMFQSCSAFLNIIEALGLPMMSVSLHISYVLPLEISVSEVCYVTMPLQIPPLSLLDSSVAFTAAVPITWAIFIGAISAIPCGCRCSCLRLPFLSPPQVPSSPLCLLPLPLLLQFAFAHHCYPPHSCLFYRCLCHKLWLLMLLLLLSATRLFGLF